MTNMETKYALKRCKNFAEVDDILNQTYCKSDSDKIEYLGMLFNMDVTKTHVTDRHEDYVIMVQSILKMAG